MARVLPTLILLCCTAIVPLAASALEVSSVGRYIVIEQDRAGSNHTLAVLRDALLAVRRQNAAISFTIDAVITEDGRSFSEKITFHLDTNGDAERSLRAVLEELGKNP